MNKIYLALAVMLACGSVHAQRDYPNSRDSRSERAVDRCVDDRARGQKLSRKEMRRLEERCSEASTRAPIYPRELQSDRRRSDPRRSSPAAQEDRRRAASPDRSGAP